ncbi:hypothetical protein AVEN_224703-1 [Araneus ventricosus]|uniref:Uncharacterized protein n=1 Tax=Araneus ventricosus TaxID=182803 RepID=A0A4Y2EWC0_ARAVE|nr:hypothetical protein AVEN_224703-1 [Araneus ventricosus]
MPWIRKYHGTDKYRNRPPLFDMQIFNFSILPCTKISAEKLKDKLTCSPGKRENKLTVLLSQGYFCKNIGLSVLCEYRKSPFLFADARMVTLLASNSEANQADS